MSNQEIPTLDIDWLVAEWVKNKKKLKKKKIDYVDKRRLKIVDKLTQSEACTPTIQPTKLQREVTVKYQPSHTERHCGLTLKLKPQKKTTITVFRGIVKGLDVNLQFYFDDTSSYPHVCSSDFCEINDDPPTLTEPIDTPVQKGLEQATAFAKIIIVQQRHRKNIVKSLELSGDVIITFQDGGKPYVKNIAEIVVKLKKIYEKDPSGDLSMLLVSRSKVQWKMEVKVEQISDSGIKVNFS